MVFFRIFALFFLFTSLSTFLHTQELTRFSENNMYGYKSGNGNTVIKPIYQNAQWRFSNRMAAVKLNGKWGFINDKGKEVISIKYDDIGITSYEDGEGHKVYFYEDLLSVYNDKKWGVVDRSGKEIVPMKYQFVTGFSNGMAAIKVNDKWGFINNKGDEVITPKFDNVNKFYGYCFKEGMAGVEISGKWGYINMEGDLVIPCKYDRISYFKNGKAWVKVGDEQIDIDKSGKELIKEQVENKTSSEIDNNIYSYPDQQPMFPGGVEAMKTYLKNHIRYSNLDLEKGDQKRVFLQFVVNRDGSIEQVKILRGASEKINAEALRVVYSMPKWIPGESGTEKIRTQCTIPINFIGNILESENDNLSKRIMLPDEVAKDLFEIFKSDNVEGLKNLFMSQDDFLLLIKKTDTPGSEKDKEHNKKMLTNDEYRLEEYNKFFTSFINSFTDAQNVIKAKMKTKIDDYFISETYGCSYDRFAGMRIVDVWIEIKNDSGDTHFIVFGFTELSNKNWGLLGYVGMPGDKYLEGPPCEPMSTIEEFSHIPKLSHIPKKNPTKEQLEKDIKIIKEYIADKNLKAQETDSGLHYVINEEGVGNYPYANDDVTVRYKVYTTDGAVFDESSEEGVTFNLQQVIKGCTEGIPKLKEGGKGVLFIPSQLAYGEKGSGVIKPNTVVVFDFELLKIVE